MQYFAAKYDTDVIRIAVPGGMLQQRCDTLQQHRCCRGTCLSEEIYQCYTVYAETCYFFHLCVKTCICTSRTHVLCQRSLYEYVCNFYTRNYRESEDESCHVCV